MAEEPSQVWLDTAGGDLVAAEQASGPVRPFSPGWIWRGVSSMDHAVQGRDLPVEAALVDRFQGTGVRLQGKNFQFLAAEKSHLSAIICAERNWVGGTCRRSVPPTRSNR